MLAGLLAPAIVQAASDKTVTLYADPATGQVFMKPARNRVRIGDYIPAQSTQEIERRIEMKTQQQLEQDRNAMKAEMEQRRVQQQQWNAEMAKQVGEIQPFAREFGDRWYKKISVGTLVFADYRYMTHTGFGPGFLDTPQTWPGVGNNSFSSFDISRAYLDFKFTPDDNFMMRVTTDAYATIGTASGDAVGKNTSWGSQLDGNLGIRLKYAYLDYNTFFKKVLKVAPMSEDKFTFGQEQNPLVDWEEALYGFRYVNLIPWNYLSLSSTQDGFSMKGPIKFNELQYADYDIGVFNDANFHQFEQSNYKQVMGRISAYPFGAKSRFQGLGITGFYNYGYANKPADLNGGPNNAGRTGNLQRIAVLMHYTAETWGIAGECDSGHNAFSSGNMFSGSGPLDQFTTPAKPTGFAQFDTMAKGILDNGQANQEGWDFFGHYDIPHTPFTIFGMYQQFLPNTNASKNPLDFYRWVAGVQYLVNKNLRFAIDSQNLTYYHDQFTFPGSELTALSGKGQKDTEFAVPRDTHALMLNMEFKY
ncbi:MAG: hypothetical protein Q7S58_06060 [Candidatus Binatus sp.]|uniref:cell envelope integrity protein TolA n=1 Tax=Candidatus Binatus sp. TaxID=2811406 RepID=UPI002719CB47|nr:hypothetical protein [Candidatus Binatus sp.]MDO8431960.1 hypothetical protein [Candidatus Binatus sp.]